LKTTASHWQTLYQNVAWSTPCHDQYSNSQLSTTIWWWPRRPLVSFWFFFKTTLTTLTVSTKHYIEFWLRYTNNGKNNTLVSNHFHSVKNILFSSAKSGDFDGMLGTGFPVSMYTTKTPIDKWCFNVIQLQEFFFYIFCKRKISIRLFYLYQRLQCTDNYFVKIKFVFFLYLLLSVSWKENGMSWDSGVPNTSILVWNL
jgi:hypothetical protein